MTPTTIPTITAVTMSCVLDMCVPEGVGRRKYGPPPPRSTPHELPDPGPFHTRVLVRVAQGELAVAAGAEAPHQASRWQLHAIHHLPLTVDDEIDGAVVADGRRGAHPAGV